MPPSARAPDVRSTTQQTHKEQWKTTLTKPYIAIDLHLLALVNKSCGRRRMKQPSHRAFHFFTCFHSKWEAMSTNCWVRDLVCRRKNKCCVCFFVFFSDATFIMRNFNGIKSGWSLNVSPDYRCAQSKTWVWSERACWASCKTQTRETKAFPIFLVSGFAYAQQQRPPPKGSQL